MTRMLRPGGTPPVGQAKRALVSFEVCAREPHLHDAIRKAFKDEDLAHLFVFATPKVDFAGFMRELAETFSCTVSGCTSAGEIGRSGYVTDHVVLVGLPRRYFAAKTVLIEDLTGADLRLVVDTLIRDRIALRSANPDKRSGFSFLMVDGMSKREDALVNAITPGLAGFPLFGGSAGDSLRFSSAFVSLGGEVYENAATVTFVATNCETRVFSINHMKPTPTRMVVTEADPPRRIVKKINAEPAAEEYARLIGKDPMQLDELIFAGHPIIVRLGDEYHVRAIQRVTKEGHLEFFSAIDEGMVLTLAYAEDMVEKLDHDLAEIVNGHDTTDILACDCVLRRIEAERSQKHHLVNQVLQKHNIAGFSTYGEQIGTLHVNHTMTGVAIFPPPANGAGNGRTA
ncbi:MAG: FIST N-terminal domain-containing protein [Pseudomonadota bacterium]